MNLDLLVKYVMIGIVVASIYSNYRLLKARFRVYDNFMKFCNESYSMGLIDMNHLERLKDDDRRQRRKSISFTILISLWECMLIVIVFMFW